MRSSPLAPPVARLGLFHLYRSDARLDCADRIMAVANDPLPPIRQFQSGVLRQKRGKFGFHRLLDQPIRPERRISVSGSAISSFGRKATTLFSVMA